MTEEALEKEIQGLKFMNRNDVKDEPINVNPKKKSVRETILSQGLQLAVNESQALFGDQTSFNQSVAELHGWMVKNRNQSMKDGQFTQWIAIAFEITKAFKSPVCNLQPFSDLAAGVGIAAECAAKENK